MARRVITIFEAQSAVGGAHDTGILDVEEFDSIDIQLFVSNALSGEIVGLVIGEMSPDTFQFFRTTGLASGSFASFGLGGRPTYSTGAIQGSVPEVPRRIRVTAQSGVGGTIYLFIWGVKHEVD